ncbi:hypothetical protein OHB24_27110 [Kribbella sp. NBC_00482]|uniref:hypothetical protein n=1 Tax=Kribbella sp. NBC_00482 TaxID=2975968 RepID=UPI002E16E478
MTEVSNEPTNDLRISPSTLYADRPTGSAIYLERMDDGPHKWLRQHGVTAMPGAYPVVVMLDPSSSRVTSGEHCDTVALEYGEEAPLARIAEAIAALQMAYEALTGAGQVDFIPNEVQS